MKEQIRVAEPGEAEVLYGWIKQWSQWFKDHGVLQWVPPYPRARFEKELDAGLVRCCAETGETKGMVTIFDSPPDYHPEGVWEDAPSWYLCRVVVARTFGGKGIGQMMLQAVEAAAAREGRRRLRIDIVASNPFLKHYWEGSGFRIVSEGSIRGTSAIFIEMEVARLPQSER